MPIERSETGQKVFGANEPLLQDLTKRRFFYRPAFDIYGGTAGLYTYGPPGCALKNNICALWRKHFIIEDNMMEIEDPTVTPYRVLDASGHVERFSDFMCKDSKDESKFYRADKLLEDHIEAMIEKKDWSMGNEKELQKVFNQADAYDAAELGQKLKEFGIKAPDTGNDLTDPYPFNLMFPTNIGPSGKEQGFLRPETAQGIFVNFKYCFEQSGGVPIGIAQIGKAYRNEIAPRGGLIRLREFSQAEIEYFVHPEKKDCPKFHRSKVAELSLMLHPHQQQLAGEGTIKMTLGDAVKKGIIANETLGYMIGRTAMFMMDIGIRAEHLRFRQHLPSEMAHYACDCWDAEVEGAGGWTETVGIADRSCYDLTQHAKHANVDLSVSETLDKPIEVETFNLSKKVKGPIGKAHGKAGMAIIAHVDGLGEAEKEALNGKGGTVTVDGTDYELTKEMCMFEKKKTKTSVVKFTPSVIEPSFGVDRLISGVFEHAYYVREGGDSEDGGMTRGVLALTPLVAPYKVCLLPLDKRIKEHEHYIELKTAACDQLSRRGISYQEDDSGAAIGRRYARNDELGIPFACTFDFQTVEAGTPLYDTVTMRERDSCAQIRVPVSAIVGIIEKLCIYGEPWETVVAGYPTQEAAEKDAAAGGAPASSEAYLEQHGVVAKLEDAFNDLMASKPSDPMGFLASKLK